MACGQLDPESAQQAGDHLILLQLRQSLGQGGAGLAGLEQQGAGLADHEGVEEPHRPGTVPAIAPRSSMAQWQA
jgi:hypothetical protein